MSPPPWIGRGRVRRILQPFEKDRLHDTIRSRLEESGELSRAHAAQLGARYGLSVRSVYNHAKQVRDDDTGTD